LFNTKFIFLGGFLFNVDAACSGARSDESSGKFWGYNTQFSHVSFSVPAFAV